MESLSFDWMHNVYLGTGRDLFASGVRTLVERGVYSYTGLTDWMTFWVMLNNASMKSAKFTRFSSVDFGKL